MWYSNSNFSAHRSEALANDPQHKSKFASNEQNLSLLNTLRPLRLPALQSSPGPFNGLYRESNSLALNDWVLYVSEL